MIPQGNIFSVCPCCGIRSQKLVLMNQTGEIMATMKLDDLVQFAQAQKASLIRRAERARQRRNQKAKDAL